MRSSAPAALPVARASGLRGLLHLLQSDKYREPLLHAFALRNIDPFALVNGDESITVHEMVELLEDLAQHADIDDLGLRLAENFHPSDWGALGYLLLNCRSIEEVCLSLRATCAYSRKMPPFIQNAMSTAYRSAILLRKPTQKHADRIQKRPSLWRFNW